MDKTTPNLSLPTAEQLTQLLRLSGVLMADHVQRVTVVHHWQGYADAILRLQLTYAPEVAPAAPRTVIGKIFGPRWYAISGQPELYVYQVLAPQMPQIPLPRFFGALDEPQAQTCQLFIEDLATQYMPVQLPLSLAQLARLVDVLVALHAHWWGHTSLNAWRFLQPEAAVTRMPQALDAAGLGVNAAHGRQAIETFRQQHEGELTTAERHLLDLLTERWAEQFRARVQHGQAITLIHGDFHLLGNLFFAKASTQRPSLKIIDWTQAKRGLGPHDVMYMLLAVDVPDRVARDTYLLRRYHAGLQAAGCTDYAWAQCLWDYRFSLLTNLFQAFFQDSVHWFRKTVEVVQVWQSADLLA